jgi:hypothetical protein
MNGAGAHRRIPRSSQRIDSLRRGVCHHRFHTMPPEAQRILDEIRRDLPTAQVSGAGQGARSFADGG